MNEPHGTTPGGARSHGPEDGEDRAEWWATLEPEALEDETRANRHRERRLLLWALVALAATVPVLWAHPGTLLP